MPFENNILAFTKDGKFKKQNYEQEKTRWEREIMGILLISCMRCDRLKCYYVSMGAKWMFITLHFLVFYAKYTTN